MSPINGRSLGQDNPLGPGTVAALLSIVSALDVLICDETISNVGCAILLAKTCSRALDGDVGEISVQVVGR